MNAGNSNSLTRIANQVQDGHTVSVEAEAGKGAGFSDQEYSRAGCMVTDVDGAWKADLIVKAKEMQTWEYARPHSGQLLMMFQVSQRPLSWGTVTEVFKAWKAILIIRAKDMQA